MEMICDANAMSAEHDRHRSVSGATLDSRRGSTFAFLGGVWLGVVAAEGYASESTGDDGSDEDEDEDEDEEDLIAWRCIANGSLKVGRR